MTVDEEKTTDVHDDKHVEAESECADDPRGDSCGSDEEVAGLRTGKQQSWQKWAEE